MKNRNQSRKYIINGVGFCLAAMLFTVFFLGIQADIRVQAENEATEIYYEGKVTGKVNVRIGAGETNDRLVVNGGNIQLKPGDTVIILEEVMVKTKPWYHVRFDLDGQVQEGFCTSSYITKTDIEITPTPLATPTPIPSPTPKPTATPIPTIKVPEVTVKPEKTGSEGSDIFIIAAIIIIAIVLIGGVSFVVIRKVSGNSEKNEMTKAVQKLQNVKLSEEAKTTKQGNVRKTPVVKPLRREDVIQEELKGMDIAKDIEEFERMNDTEERIKEEANRENEEKKAIRQEIEDLREHDLVEHKFFGRGEVFDNSDVHLIEVRFGNDVRFLNKDTLVKKKLLRKSDEINTRWHI